MVWIFLSLSMADPSPPPQVRDEGALLCLEPPAVRERILRPLIELQRCRAEAEILLDENDACARMLNSGLSDLHTEKSNHEQTKVEASRKLRRARRNQAVSASGGAGVVITIILLLVLL